MEESEDEVKTPKIIRTTKAKPIHINIRFEVYLQLDLGFAIIKILIKPEDKRQKETKMSKDKLLLLILGTFLVGAFIGGAYVNYFGVNFPLRDSALQSSAMLAGGGGEAGDRCMYRSNSGRYIYGEVVGGGSGSICQSSSGWSSRYNVSND